MASENPFLKFIKPEAEASAVTEGPAAGSGVPALLQQIYEQNGNKLPPELDVKRGKLTEEDLAPYLPQKSRDNPFLKFVPGEKLPPPPPSEVPEQELERARAEAPQGFIPNLARTAMGWQGQMTAAQQGVNPVKLPQGRLIGEYTETDSGPAVRIPLDNGKNKYVKFDPEKFAAQRDEQSGKMMVYMRTPQAEAGTAQNLGRVLAMNPVDLARMPMTAAAQAPSKVEQMRTVGVTPTPYASGERLPSMLGSFAEQQLMGAPPMLKAQEKIQRETAQGGQRGVAMFGQGRAAADAGESLAEMANKYSKSTRQLAQDIFEPVDRALGYKGGARPIGPNGERLSFQIDTPQFLNVLKSMQETGVKGIDDLMNTPAFKKLGEDLASKGVVGIDYEIVKQLRSAIGEKIGAFGGAGADMSQKEARRLYAALTQDLKNGLPPEARAAFVKANAEYSKIAATNQKLQQAFRGAGTVPKSGESAFGTFYRAVTGQGDRALLAKVKNTLSADEFDDIASSVIAEAGKPAATAAREVQDLGFSIEDFYKNINKMTPEAKDALFGKTGPRRKYVDALLDVGDMVKKSGATRNRSNTGGVMWTGGTIASSLAAGGAYGATQSPWAFALPVLFQLASYGTAKAVNAPIANGLDTVLKLAKKSKDATQFTNRLRLLADSNPYVKEAITQAQGAEQ